ncbi:hypothetical protein D3C85_1736480 [compost metagenome]
MASTDSQRATMPLGPAEVGNLASSAWLLRSTTETLSSKALLTYAREPSLAMETPWAPLPTLVVAMRRPLAASRMDRVCPGACRLP